MATSQDLAGNLSQRLGRDYEGEKFSSLLRNENAPALSAGEYLRNINLIYHEWQRRAFMATTDTARMRRQLLGQFFKQ